MFYKSFIHGSICHFDTAFSEIQVKRKQEVVIGNLGPGDSFGEKSFITNELLEQSVVAEKNLIIAIIGVEDFQGNL